MGYSHLLVASRTTKHILSITLLFPARLLIFNSIATRIADLSILVTTSKGMLKPTEHFFRKDDRLTSTELNKICLIYQKIFKQKRFS